MLISHSTGDVVHFHLTLDSIFFKSHTAILWWYGFPQWDCFIFYLFFFFNDEMNDLMRFRIMVLRWFRTVKKEGKINSFIWCYTLCFEFYCIEREKDREGEKKIFFLDCFELRRDQMFPIEWIWLEIVQFSKDNVCAIYFDDGKNQFDTNLLIYTVHKYFIWKHLENSQISNCYG